ncbi:MAG: hypothetical protein QF521_25730, partial [Alphaproteobacteria bacterium]|nr:hypothetical protein [Alphaproteobacteria bacterium]
MGVVQPPAHGLAHVSSVARGVLAQRLVHARERGRQLGALLRRVVGLRDDGVHVGRGDDALADDLDVRRRASLQEALLLEAHPGL